MSCFVQISCEIYVSHSHLCGTSIQTCLLYFWPSRRPCYQYWVRTGSTVCAAGCAGMYAGEIIYIPWLVILDVSGRHIPSDIDWFTQQELDGGGACRTGNWPKSGYRSMSWSESGRGMRPSVGSPGVVSKGLSGGGFSLGGGGSGGSRLIK